MVNNNYKKDTGYAGEDLAIEHLQKHGYRILERNFTIWGGEIDIITQKGEEIIFVEVKTRKVEEIDYSLLISNSKQKTLIRSAEFWLNKNGYNDADWRFDVVIVILKQSGKVEFEVIEDALSYN